MKSINIFDWEIEATYTEETWKLVSSRIIIIMILLFL